MRDLRPKWPKVMAKGPCLVNINSNNNKKKKKKIYNAHIVKHQHESEAQAVARWPDGVC